MIKIKALSFEKSAELERALNDFEVPYKWDYNEGYLGCIGKLYDIEITDKHVTVAYAFQNLLEVEIWRSSEKLDVYTTVEEKRKKIMIDKDKFKEVIIS